MSFGERRCLPNRRSCATFETVHRAPNGSDRHYTVSVGYFDREHRDPGEVFITGPKIGSELEAVARDCAILWSIARQYGAPIDVLAHALTREEDGSPSTVIGRIADILTAVSIEGFLENQGERQ